MFRISPLKKEAVGYSETSVTFHRITRRHTPIHVNPLKTKRRPLYLKTHSVPRCKHFSSQL